MTSVFMSIIDILQCYVIRVRFASSELIESKATCDHDAAFANNITYIIHNSFIAVQVEFNYTHLRFI